MARVDTAGPYMSGYLHNERIALGETKKKKKKKDRVILCNIIDSIHLVQLDKKKKETFRWDTLTSRSSRLVPNWIGLSPNV